MPELASSHSLLIPTSLLLPDGMKESREVFKGTSNFEELTAEQQEVARENLARFVLLLIEEDKKETQDAPLRGASLFDP